MFCVKWRKVKSSEILNTQRYHNYNLEVFYPTKVTRRESRRQHLDHLVQNVHGNCKRSSEIFGSRVNVTWSILNDR